MRKVMFAVLIAALSVSVGLAQPPGGGGGGRGGRGGGRGGPPAPPPAPPPAGLECFDNLPTPEFPRAALQQKVDGTVWVNLEVGAGGAVDKLESQVTSAWADGAKLLTPPAEAAVRAAKIKADCAGKKVLVVFRYELHGEPTANPQVTSKKEPSYLMWIESQPLAAAGARGGKK
jgi:outer membrane biosynthesis protein TonB